MDSEDIMFSEISQWQKEKKTTALWLHLSKAFRVAKTIWTEKRVVTLRVRDRGCLMGRVYILEEERILEMDPGSGCTLYMLFTERNSHNT